MKKTLPQPRKTLVICSSENAETTKIIKEWHEKVNEVLTKKEVYHSLFNSTGKLRKASLSVVTLFENVITASLSSIIFYVIAT